VLNVGGVQERPERNATVPRVYPTLVSGVLNLDDRTENAGGY
jgi:hypothetical protein